MEYAEFLERKSQTKAMGGFKPLWMPECLYGFQHYLTSWAIQAGRSALVEDCGLGKGLPPDEMVLTPFGWKAIARYHVWKEPLMVRNRTMVKSLHHKTLTIDSTKCSMANADYLLIFRRSGKNPIPVEHPRGLLSYAGSTQIPPELIKWRGFQGNQIKNEYSHWIWRQYASAFWSDVRIDRTLGHGASLYSAAKADKDEPDEKHMHPLQLDVIERAVVLWSNRGEKVLSPYMGVGSEVYGAVINGRLGIGCELHPAYYRQAVKNLAEAKETTLDDLGYQPEMFHEKDAIEAAGLD